MSNDSFTLVDEPTQVELDETGPVAGVAIPGKVWAPSSKADSFQGLLAQKPAAEFKRSKSSKSKKNNAPKPEDLNGSSTFYVPLPEVQAPKTLSKAQQKKADTIQLTKEREADAATMRINGVDGEVEIPKKAWLTIFNGKRARPDEIAETLTDLASMLENGESEHHSVSALAVQYSLYDIGQAYERTVMLLDRGVTLGAAMADQQDTFPPVVRELISAAKMPKDMHRNLRQAAIIIVEADNIKSQVKSALFKPGLMLVFLMLFTIAAVQWLMPMTSSMFSGIGAQPPKSTQIIMAIGGALKWVLLAVLVIAFFAAMFWKFFGKDNERLAVKMDTWGIKAPLVGDIIRMSTAARFCDVLAACLSVGMSEIESLETASRACGNRALSRWIEDHVSRQRVGIVAFGDVAKTELLPWNFRNRIETTTSLVRRIEILSELATTFHIKSQERLNRFAERVGPITEGVTIVIVIVVVLLIVSPVLTFIPTMIATIS